MNYYLQQFLESSTIHGLVYISTESKFARFFWVLVVITGFTIATLLISQSFTNWSDSPFKTTIETKPISEITFPKVTVCPPKNTFTDLNYDLMMLENMTLTKNTKQNLLDHTFAEFLTQHERDQLSNVSKLEEDNRLHNWYHGYTAVQLTSWESDGLNYLIYTSATTGSVKTQYFGDKYDPDKIDKKLHYQIIIIPPVYLSHNPAYTLTIEIEKVSMNVS